MSKESKELSKDEAFGALFVFGFIFSLSVFALIIDWVHSSPFFTCVFFKCNFQSLLLPFGILFGFIGMIIGAYYTVKYAVYPESIPPRQTTLDEMEEKWKAK